MSGKAWFWWAAGIGGLLLLSAGGYLVILRPFLQKWELYRARPYWDVKQWSWGYGTRVPNSINDPLRPPGGTISEPDAMRAMIAHIAKDREYLAPLVKIPLTSRQWAALLSFSYNLGPGNADNLIPEINSRSWVTLRDRWKSYVYSGGTVNQNLVDRRAAEWSLFTS